MHILLSLNSDTALIHTPKRLYFPDLNASRSQTWRPRSAFNPLNSRTFRNRFSWTQISDVNELPEARRGRNDRPGGQQTTGHRVQVEESPEDVFVSRRVRTHPLHSQHTRTHDFPTQSPGCSRTSRPCSPAVEQIVLLFFFFFFSSLYTTTNMQHL